MRRSVVRSIPDFHHDEARRLLCSDEIDYLQFKLFQLSIIWRASISENPGFAQVNLGPHEEKVRQMLDEENPGTSSQYGCIMIVMLNTELLHKIIVGPIVVKPKPFGHTVYKFTTGNIEWLFFVTNHAIKKQVQEFFLQETGVLKIWLASNEDERDTLVNIAKNFKVFHKGNQNF